jgi:hypothetical protein
MDAIDQPQISGTFLAPRGLPPRQAFLQPYGLRLNIRAQRLDATCLL